MNNNLNDIDIANLMSGMKGGTPISNIQNFQYTQPPNNPNFVQNDNKYIKNTSDNNNMQYTKTKNKKKKKNNNVEKFVSQINKSVDKINVDDNSEKEPKQPYKSKVPKLLKEPLILLLIYIILSLHFVREFFGKYIKYINPNDEGNVSFLGIVIYGIILVLLFIVSRLILM